VKIAFVNQPIDRIVPPFQSSIGICTYGVARSLAKASEVVVYGLQDRHQDLEPEAVHQDILFRFIPSTPRDRLLYRARTKYSKLVQASAPISTSSCLYPSYGRRVALDLRQQRCDVIHVQQGSQYVPVIRELNPSAKIVLHLHAEWFSQSNPRILRQRLRGVDLLTTVSDHIRRRTRHDFPAVAERCETMPNGIDTAEFSRDKVYGEPQGEGRRILFVGAVSPHSGVHVLLDAFKMLVESYPDVRLDIVGHQGSYPLGETFDLKDRAALESVARFYANNALSRLKAKMSLAPRDAGTYQAHLEKQLPPDIANKVRFLGCAGVRQDLVDLYYNADIFAFPPVCNHGFGIPPVEAMAAGLPVVATRSGGVVETVRDRETGLLVEKNDARGLALAMLKLLRHDSLREAMGKAARRRAFEHYTWDGVAARMLDRYQKLLEPQPTPVAVSMPEHPVVLEAKSSRLSLAEAEEQHPSGWASVVSK
jgi:glycosyltransferase involved in cell wall biosynthesis